MKILFRTSCVISFGFVSAVAHADNLSCLTLDKAIQTAADQAPSVAVAEATQKEAEYAIDSARSLFKPQLSLFTRSGIGDSSLVDSSLNSQAGLRVSQRVFDFGDAKHARKSSQERFDASVNDTRQMKYSVSLDVAMLFVQYKEAEAELELVKERERYFSEQLGRLENMLERGEVTVYETAEVGAQLAQSKSQRLDLEFRKNQAKISLEIRAGKSPNQCVEYQSETLLGRYDELTPAEFLIPQILESNPAILASVHRSRASEAEKKRLNSNSFPTIDIVGIGAYSSSGALEDAQFRDYVGVNFSVPLYSGGELKSKKRAALARESAAMARIEESKRELKERVLVIFKRIDALRNQLKFSQQAELRNLEQFELIEKEREIGSKTLTDEIEARVRYEAAATRTITTQFNLDRLLVELLIITTG